MATSSAGACPTRDLRERFRRGLLGDPELELLAEHIANCPQCSREFNTASAGDPIMSVLRRSLRQSPLPDEEACVAVAARVRTWEAGIDLDQLIAARGPLAIADACELARQAALAAAHLHSEGLVHRDIKPENLILTKVGAVKLLNPHPSLHEESPAAGWTLIGTADYVAPEQIIVASHAGPAADVYSIGCTLFKLLTGRAPFEDTRHRDPRDKLRAHSLKTAPDVRGARADAPQDLAILLSRLLAKRPAERGSADDLAAALEPFAQGQRVAELVSQESPPAP